MIGNEKAQLCTGGGDELCIENQRYLRKIDASEGKEAEEKGTNLFACVFSPARTKNTPNPPPYIGRCNRTLTTNRIAGQAEVSPGVATRACVVDNLMILFRECKCTLASSSSEIAFIS